MANNRMFLLHNPSGLCVYLGKRLAWGWYSVPKDLGKQLQTLFDHLRANPEGHQDDFVVAVEDAKGASMATDKWIYGKDKDGFGKLEPKQGNY